MQDELADLSAVCYRNESMSVIDEDLRCQINQLVDAYRDRCLWFLRVDYYPTDLQEVLRTLDYIRRYGDQEAFRKAGELYQWLSPNSSGPSAVS
ncbi:MAG: hypothetical protein JW955_21000 [Sedimentisphaerales bacterium]|nr:hypothetical protein [Sedimentisphaerales bacterium]